LAAVQLSGLEYDTHKFIFIPSSLFITREVISSLNVGLGDEVYMVGRFVHHEGVRQNSPAIRSGIIAVMADENEGIDCPRAGRHHEQEAFLVEMRSISGFSGSPVIFRMPLRDFEMMRVQRYLEPEADNFVPGPWLLGINSGCFLMYDKVYEVSSTGDRIETQYEARSHSGFSIVIPAWRLEKLLKLPEFVEMRDRIDKETTRLKRNSPVDLHVWKS
jgi:hypothetical protein